MYKKMNKRVFAITIVVFLSTLSLYGVPPSIGIIYPAEHFEMLMNRKIDRLQSYREAVEEHGAVVMVLGQGMASQEIEDILHRINGLLLPGGIDVSPERYGEAPHPKLEKTDAALDALEWQALEVARVRRVPVLGICRGHQVINVFFGGSLFQDIPSQYQSKLAVVHRNGNQTHEIIIMPTSRLYELIGCERISVNSYHHQAIKEVAPGFTVSARAEDGIPEAIENEGDIFILGVQFHPEKMLHANPRLKGIFARFVQEANCYAQSVAVPPE